MLARRWQFDNLCLANIKPARLPRSRASVFRGVKGLLAAALLCLTGCAIDRNGVVHHVVIGFGVVSVPKTNTVAQVTKVKALGVYYSGMQMAAGYIGSTVTEVSPSATNLVLEIK